MLIKKMLRDIKVNKIPFIAIFLMMFMANFIFSGITSEYHGLQSKFNRYIEETQLADGWVYGSLFEEDKIGEFKNDPSIQMAEGRILVPTTVSSHQKQSIDLYVKEEDTLSKFKVIEGVSYQKDIDGIWLDAQFASANSYQLHDTITLEYQGIKLEKEIVGLGYHPEYIYSVDDGQMVPDHQNNGFALMSKAYFPYPMAYNQLLILGEGDLKTAVQDHFSQAIMLMQKDHPAYLMVSEEINQHKEIGILFVCAFLFIAALVTMTTLHRLLSSQRMQIGVLKSLGFNKRQLFIHYITHSTFVCFIGALSGFFLGYLALPPLLLNFMNEMYTIPDLKAQLLPYAWLLPLGCTLLCGVISFLICRKYLRGNAAKIINGNTNEKKYKPLPFSTLWQHLSFSSQWNGRDIFRNKLRSIMSVLGVIGCVALLYGAFGLYTSMNHLTSWNMDMVQTYETKVTGDFSDEAYTQKIKTLMDGETIMESGVEIRQDQQSRSVTFTALESQHYLHLMKNEKEEIELMEGLAVSKNIADDLNLQIGDSLQWKLNGSDQWLTSTITAIIRTPLNQGITIKKEELKRLGIVYQPTSIIGHAFDESLLESEFTTSIQNKEDLQAGLDTMMQASIMMCTVFVIAAVLLGSVILYNLGTLSYNERYYEMATLKVLGFSDSRIRRLMIQQNLWLSVIGIVLGLPVGYQFILVLLSTVQATIDMTVYIPISIYLFSILGTLLLSWAINRLLSRKVYHIDMVAALKANE